MTTTLDTEEPVAYAWLRTHAQQSQASNESLIATLAEGEISEATRESALRALAMLVVQPPIVQFLAHIGDCAWSRYLKASPKRYSSMHTLLKFVQHSDICQAIFLAYERFPDIRPTIERMHEMEDDNRVPYLHVFFKSQRAALDLSDSLRSPEGVAAMIRRPEFQARLDALEASGRSKSVGGATNTHIGMYDWIATADKSIRPKFDLIARAAYRVDLGGGYATPDISRVLRAPFVSHDITDPTTVEPSLLFTGRWAPADFDQKGYIEALRTRPWVRFDVFEDKYPKGRGPYVISSFGFLTSTVTSQSRAEANPKSSFATLLAGLNGVLDLVAAGEDVYCYWYSRASRRLYQNAIIQLHFQNRRLVAHEICACHFSNLQRFQATSAAVKGAHLFPRGGDAG